MVIHMQQHTKSHGAMLRSVVDDDEEEDSAHLKHQIKMNCSTESIIMVTANVFGKCLSSSGCCGAWRECCRAKRWLLVSELPMPGVFCDLEWPQPFHTVTGLSDACKVLGTKLTKQHQAAISKQSVPKSLNRTSN
jgi:hypothetical protein